MTWTPNHNSGGFRAMMLSPRMAAAMSKEGGKVAARYRATAPIRTGRLRSSVRVSTRVNQAKTPRRIAVIEVTAPYAADLEFGHKTRKGFIRGGHYLKKALG